MIKNSKKSFYKKKFFPCNRTRQDEKEKQNHQWLKRTYIYYLCKILVHCRNKNHSQKEKWIRIWWLRKNEPESESGWERENRCIKFLPMMPPERARERERESETMRLHRKLKKDKEVQILLQMFVNLSVLIITRTACT